MNRQLLFLFLIFLVFLSTGKNLWAASGVTSDVSQLTFTNQAEGTVSAAQTVTLTNSLAGDGIIGTLTIGGNDPAQFLVVEDHCSGVVLANGQSCGVSVVYRPSLRFPDGVGAASADLVVPFNDPPSLTILLSGSSVAPEIGSDFSDLNFGIGTVGELTEPLIVTLTNTGEADLILEDTKITGANSSDFGLTMDLCSFQRLSPGETCQIELSMRPTDLGNRNAILVVKNNDPDEALFQILLTGAGKGSGGCSLHPFASHSSETLGWALVFTFFVLLRAARRKSIHP